MARRLAVVLFNLGGPDRPEAVQPFLKNLFSDPAILRVPGPVRWLLARIISRRRAPAARGIYARLGGSSPLLAQTREQADALDARLAEDKAAGDEVRCFIAMRYWHPMSDETAREVAAWRPDAVVLLPLYPQFSTTTTGSSLADWHRAAAAAGLSVATRAVCCYPDEAGLVAAHAGAVGRALDGAGAAERRVRVLFSAHGLPKRVVETGDPYQWQVERTVDRVVRRVRHDRQGAAFEFEICYQSRVGPLQWIGPATDDEIRRAGRDGVGIVMVPIAFVSEHSETLVELDIEYRELADEHGVPTYERLPALRTDPDFIGGLAGLVHEAAGWPDGTVGACGGHRICPAAWTGCPIRSAAG